MLAIERTPFPFISVGDKPYFRLLKGLLAVYILYAHCPYGKQGQLNSRSSLYLSIVFPIDDRVDNQLQAFLPGRLIFSFFSQKSTLPDTFISMQFAWVLTLNA